MSSLQRATLSKLGIYFQRAVLRCNVGLDEVMLVFAVLKTDVAMSP